ncbi:Ubiquitin carboxyl-terminal hydrolase 7, ICP0-binding domain [Dillenia turbinata]|uniref:Ubiquitin carboxyl-terminal hydrolase 7, ICP0-binding domain n=1 Tax=Dillenia turbinata TaxID=194707 RepID=A0AAN8V7J5_9MAGN
MSISCFQNAPRVNSNEHCRYPDVPSFLDYVHNRQVVRFRYLEKPKRMNSVLSYKSKLFNYDDTVERVARQLGLVDPSKIRLTSHNCYSKQPKPQPIKSCGVDHLSDMLVHYNQFLYLLFLTADIQYYEVLDIPLPKLQGLKTIKVAFHNATKEEVCEVVSHGIRLPKQSNVGDVICDLKTKPFRMSEALQGSGKELVTGKQSKTNLMEPRSSCWVLQEWNMQWLGGSGVAGGDLHFRKERICCSHMSLGQWDAILGVLRQYRNNHPEDDSLNRPCCHCW